jgi:hypothetical protein
MKKTFVMALLLALAMGACSKKQAAAPKAPSNTETKADDKAAAPADKPADAKDAKAAPGGGGSMKDPCEGGQ